VRDVRGRRIVLERDLPRALQREHVRGLLHVGRHLRARLVGQRRVRVGGAACVACPAGNTCANGTCSDNPCFATCSGCCTLATDASGMMVYTCIDSSDALDWDSHCGHGGGACVSCAATEICGGGVCVSRAAAEACPNGCLDAAGACQSGTSASACGTGGVRCAACTGVLTCTSEQHCDVPDDTQWDVQFLNGSIPSTNASGDAWDAFGGLPDPRAQFDGYTLTFPTPPGSFGNTPTLDNTLSPNWGGATVLTLPRGGFRSSSVYLDDMDIAYTDRIAECDLEITYRDPALVQSVFSGEVQTCRGLNGSWVRWRVRPHP
jgi:hypothetical protein